MGNQKAERRECVYVSDHSDYKWRICGVPPTANSEQIVQGHYDTGRVDMISLNRKVSLLIHKHGENDIAANVVKVMVIVVTVSKISPWITSLEVGV